MNAKTSKLLKQYAFSVLPQPVRQKYPGMVRDLQRWLKCWWITEFNHREREAFRHIAQRLGPLPERLKKLAHEHGIIVIWPPAPKEKKKPLRRDWGKSKSWRHERYGGKR